MTTSQAWLPKQYSTWFSIQKLNPSKELQFREQTGGDVCLRCKPYDDTDDEVKLTSLADKVALLVPTFELWAALTSKPDPHLRLRPQLPESDWCQVSSHLLRDWFGLKVMSALQPTMEVTIDVNSETSGSNIIEYGKRSKFPINVFWFSHQAATQFCLPEWCLILLTLYKSLATFLGQLETLRATIRVSTILICVVNKNGNSKMAILTYLWFQHRAPLNDVMVNGVNWIKTNKLK